MSAGVATEATPAEALVFTIAGMLRGLRHVAVGAASPIPGAATLLARAWSQAAGATPLRLSMLGSRDEQSFTNGGVEVFDLAAQGRLDAFFLGGGQIDAQANVNLVGTGPYPRSEVRWPGSFGSAYLYHLVPRVILFREEHTRRVFVPKVDFVSAAGPRDDGIHRPGGPHALLTRLCLFGFDRTRRRFVLTSVHAGHTLDEVRDCTGFDFDAPGIAPITPQPDAATLALIRGRVRAEIARTYPKFAASLPA
jgi:glutaconate CoA-transferase subunit B